MITQTVIYKPNPNNEHAANLIIANARNILGEIRDTLLEVGAAISSNRSMVITNGCVVKTTAWRNKVAMTNYFAHPALREWCKFVLRGWIVKGSKVPDLEGEFIEKVLNGDKSFEWERNPKIKEDQVVWAGEQIAISARSGANVVLPGRDEMLQILDSLGSGTNANWQPVFCNVLASYHGTSFSNGAFAKLLSDIVSVYIDGVPRDLRMTVKLKIPEIVVWFVDEPYDQATVIQRVVANCFS